MCASVGLTADTTVLQHPHYGLLVGMRDMLSWLGTRVGPEKGSRPGLGNGAAGWRGVCLFTYLKDYPLNNAGVVGISFGLGSRAGW